MNKRGAIDAMGSGKADQISRRNAAPVPVFPTKIVICTWQ
jgi:hypothetical protein